MTVTNLQLGAFLEREGWERIGRDDLGESWIKPGDANAPAVLVPLKPAGDMYEQLVDAAITRLEWVTGLVRSQLVQAISATADTLEVRVIDPSTARGLIPLERGVQLAQSLKTIVLNGARLQFAGGRIAHAGGLSHAAREVMDQLEMTPPSVGSFRYTIQAPVRQQLTIETADQAHDDPVHETLVSAVQALQAARETAEAPIPKNADDLEEVVSRGVSANLVRAVRALDTQNPALRVEFRANWASPDPRTIEVVELSSTHFAGMRQLEDVLRPYEPTQDYRLGGWIKVTEADELALTAPLIGTVVVEARVRGRTRKVHIDLTAADLERAAAGLGRQRLSAVGTLERIGRSWYLTSPRDVQIADI